MGCHHVRSSTAPPSACLPPALYAGSLAAPPLPGWGLLPSAGLVVVDDLDGHRVDVGMAGDGLVVAVGLDLDGRRTSAARVHAVLQQEDVWLLGPVDLIHVDLPGAVQRALRGQYGWCKQQGPDRYKEQKSFHRVS